MAKKILVVDDEIDIAKVTSARLKKLGYEVTNAFSGEEALDFLNKGAFDLVLLDILLPGIQGYDVCRQIKNSDKLKNIPVIFFTATVTKIPEAVKEFGADDYITKPFEVEDLIRIIKKYLNEE